MSYLLVTQLRFVLLMVLVWASTAPVVRAQGVFGSPTLYPLSGSGSRRLAVGDISGDGLPDLVAAGSGVNVLLNQASAPGVFVAGGTYATGLVGGLAVGDVNRDGRMDVLVNTPASSQLAVFLASSAGAGTLQAPVYYSTGGGGGDMVAGDLNGDGNLDVALLTTAGLGVLLGTSSGTFGPVSTYPAGGMDYLVLGDVNGDGRPDLVANDNAYSGAAPVGGVYVLLNSATDPGTFGSRTRYPSNGVSTDGVALGDLNNDNLPDIVAANSGYGTTSVLLASAATPGTFQPVANYGGCAGAAAVTVADVNGDNWRDVVVACTSTTSVVVLFGRAAAPGSLAVATGANFYTTNSRGPVVVRVADLNADGRPDAATVSSIDNAAAVLLNTSTPLAAKTGSVAAGVEVHPNPAAGAFTVQLPALAAGTSVQARLLNALGQVVYRQQPAVPGGTTSLGVVTAGLAPGVYTLHLQLGEAVVTRRVVLE